VQVLHTLAKFLNFARVRVRRGRHRHFPLHITHLALQLVHFGDLLALLKVRILDLLELVGQVGDFQVHGVDLVLVQAVLGGGAVVLGQFAFLLLDHLQDLLLELIELVLLLLGQLAQLGFQLVICLVYLVLDAEEFLIHLLVCLLLLS